MDNSNSSLFDYETFINEVKCHPVLWDQKNPNFNHRQAKTTAWEEVAVNLYADSENWSNYDKFGKVRDIQKRWKNMRDTYIKDLKYQRKVEQGLVMAKRKRYVYAHLMDFLTPRKRPPSKSCSEKSSSEDDEKDGDANKQTFNGSMLMDEGYSSSYMNQLCSVSLGSPFIVCDDDNSKRSTPEQMEKTSPHRNVSALKFHPDITSQGSNTSFSAPQTQNALKNISDPCTSRLVSATDINSDVSSIRHEQDDDKMFLLSLLPYFKKFEDDKKLQARINVTKMLHDMLYKQC